MEQKKVTVGVYTDEAINEIIQEFKNESDRATVILGAAQIDAQLYLLLSKFLKPSAHNTDELLDGDSPLSTLSSRINMCYRLGLINAHFSKSLHLIRKIRNSFAHEIKGVSLTAGGHSDRVRELVVHFKDYDGYQNIKSELFGDKQGLDIDFRMLLGIAIIRLDTAIHYASTISESGTEFIPPAWIENNQPAKATKKIASPKKTVKKNNAE